MNYSDEQLKRVAAWLGYEVGWQTNPDILDKDGNVAFYFLNKDFFDWLLSPEGRVAIEDKAIEVGWKTKKQFLIYYEGEDNSDVGIPPHYVIVAEFSLNSIIIGHGPTPAEAWLDAAIKMTEEK